MKHLARLQAAFASLRIGTRLTLAFATVLVLTAGLGIAALINLSRLHQTATELATNWLPSVISTTSARAVMLEYRELEVKHARAAAGIEDVRPAIDHVGRRESELAHRHAVRIVLSALV